MMPSNNLISGDTKVSIEEDGICQGGPHVLELAGLEEAAGLNIRKRGNK